MLNGISGPVFLWRVSYTFHNEYSHLRENFCKFRGNFLNKSVAKMAGKFVLLISCIYGVYMVNALVARDKIIPKLYVDRVVG